MSLILFAIYSSYAIEFVSIEHPGNIANKYGYGALDYLYQKNVAASKVKKVDCYLLFEQHNLRNHNIGHS